MQGRDLFPWRYTGYGRSQGVVTPSFLSAIKATFERKQAYGTKKEVFDFLHMVTSHNETSSIIK